MTRRKKDPLRPLTSAERRWLERISRAQSEPASHVVRAQEILAVAEGKSYTEAARTAGRKSGDAVSKLVSEFNQNGLAAIRPRHGGGAVTKYGPAERERILTEARRKPEPAQDGTASWSLQTLRRALRNAPDGLPEVSEDTIRTVLREAGFSWQRSQTWCETGQVVRKRKRGQAVTYDPDTESKKS
jgi:transposase